jgi:superoxide reductase
LVLLVDKGVPLICCGEKVSELAPNTTDASVEKHVPDVTISGDLAKVQVGSAPHPMTEEHHISFVYVKTEKGGQRKCLEPGMEPNAAFCFTDDKPLSVFAHCNLHGLWKVEL